MNIDQIEPANDDHKDQDLKLMFESRFKKYEDIIDKLSKEVNEISAKRVSCKDLKFFNNFP